MYTCCFPYHDAVGLADGPQVDLLVIAAGDEHAAGLVAQRQAVHVRPVGHELLWKVNKTI